VLPQLGVKQTAVDLIDQTLDIEAGSMEQAECW